MIIENESLHQGFPTDGPPGCIMWPAATFVNCVYTIKITQWFRRLGIPLIAIFPYATQEPANNNRHGPVS
jgi:hypothetical protein